MRSRGFMKSRRSGVVLLGVFGVALVAAIVLIAGLYAGPASARPGNLCDPEPGHGLPGCHVEVTTSTMPPATSPTAGSSGATGDAAEAASTTSSVTTSSTVPSVGPERSIDPSAPRPYVDENNCLSCHGDPTLDDIMTMVRPDGTSVSLFVDPDGLAYSVHRFNDCTMCHTDRPHDVQTPLTKLSLAEKCGSCHDFQYAQHKISIHGAPLQEGNSDPATCTDCHSSTSSPHNIERVLDPSATTYPKNIADTCGKCHDNPDLMGKYGIVEKVYDSYMRSFHGKAISLSGENAALQQLGTATCVNCHGSHNIMSTKNGDSPVAGMENLAETCEQCHPGAGVEFAQSFLGHKEADPDYVPQVYWGERFFYVFTRLVLAGGVVLVVAPFWRWGLDKVKQRRKPPKDEE